LDNQAILPLIFVAEGDLASAQLSGHQSHWASQHGFTGQRGRLLAVPGAEGEISAWLFGTGAPTGRPPFVAGLAGANLPEGAYALRGDYGDPTIAAIAFRLGAYRFEHYRDPRPAPALVMPEKADAEEVERQVLAATLARDLINMPANDLGPDGLEHTVRDFAIARGMAINVIAGEALETGFPLIHAVGRASAEHPRLIDLSWGDPSHSWARASPSIPAASISRAHRACC
jgi:leucyl aminopeptidase